MRRSRVQVRPNIGARQTKSVEVKEEETKKVKDADNAESSTEKPKKEDDGNGVIIGTSGDQEVIQSKKTEESVTSEAPPVSNTSNTATSAVGRRSRIKPQVKIMANKPRGSTSTTVEKAKDKEESLCTTSTPSKESGDGVQQESSSTIMTSENTALLDKATAQITEAQNKTEEISSDSQPKETADKSTPTTQRRSRSAKPKPNIVDSVRKRARLSSMSGASDTDEDNCQSLLKKAPPPVQRIAALASPPQTNVPGGEVSETDAGGGAGGAVVASSAMEVDHEVSVTSNADTETVKTEGTAKARHEARKKMKMKKERREVKRTSNLSEPVDKVKMKISDLIYYNPTTNRMKSSLEEEERKKNNKENKDDKSVVGSPRRDSVAGSPDRQSILSADNRSVARSTTTNSVVAGPDSPGADEPLLVPQLKVGADGQIVVNEESLVVNNPSLNVTIEDEGEVVEEFSNAPYKPSQYYGRLCKTKAWSWRETKKFYLALSVIGSDFSMMSSLFPGRDRLDLKKKFKKEEKQNRWLVDKALKDTKTYDLSIFDTLSSSDDEETKKLKEKQEKERKKAEAKEKKRIEREKVQQLKKEEKEKLKEAKKKKPKKKKLTSQYYDASSSDDSDKEASKVPEPIAVTPVSGVTASPASVVKFNCDLCEKSFKSKSALRAHIYRHTKNLKINLTGKPELKGSENQSTRAPPSQLVSPTNLTPGGHQQQLLFVTSTTPCDKDGTPGQSVVHMYMVSPPPIIPQNPASKTIPDQPDQTLLLPATVTKASSSSPVDAGKTESQQSGIVTVLSSSESALTTPDQPLTGPINSSNTSTAVGIENQASGVVTVLTSAGNAMNIPIQPQRSYLDVEKVSSSLSCETTAGDIVTVLSSSQMTTPEETLIDLESSGPEAPSGDRIRSQESSIVTVLPLQSSNSKLQHPQSEDTISIIVSDSIQKGETPKLSDEAVLLRLEKEDGSLWTCDSDLVMDDNSKEPETDDVVFVDLSGAQRIDPAHVTDESVGLKQMANEVLGNKDSVRYLQHDQAGVPEYSKANNRQVVFVQDDHDAAVTMEEESGKDVHQVIYDGNTSDVNVNNSHLLSIAGGTINTKLLDLDQVSKDVLDKSAVVLTTSQCRGVNMAENSKGTSVLPTEAMNQSKQTADYTSGDNPEEVKTIRIKIFNSPGTEPNCPTDSQNSQANSCETASEIRLFLG